MGLVTRQTHLVLERVGTEPRPWVSWKRVGVEIEHCEKLRNSEIS